MSDDSMVEEKIVSIGPKLIKSHRDLKVYQRAYRASLDIHKTTLEFPRIEQYALADQLRRSSKSVCANIAEGFARQKYSTKEFSRFLAVAEGSAQETQVWLEYAFDLAYINNMQFDSWQDDYIAIASMLNKFIATL
jgi:four helix bundle protein